jgi:hypothetical protein
MGEMRWAVSTANQGGTAGDYDTLSSLIIWDEGVFICQVEEMTREE